MRRAALTLLLALAAPAHGQSRVVVDSLIARITHTWGVPPRGGWCAEWSVVRGDSNALHGLAEVSGSERSKAVFACSFIRVPAFALPPAVRIGAPMSDGSSGIALSMRYASPGSSSWPTTKG